MLKLPSYNCRYNFFSWAWARFLGGLIFFPLLLGMAPAWAAPANGNEIWQKADEKIQAGLANEAFTQIEKIYQQAEQTRNSQIMARALFKLAQIKTGVYELEKALELLYRLALPPDPAWRGLLLAFRAHLLYTYYQFYRGDILLRQEKSSATDFREWTAQQIWQSCEQDFAQAWKLRQALGQHLIQEQPGIIEPGTLPASIRPTWRDFLTHAWAAFLANQETWTPEQSEQLFHLAGQTLASPEPALSFPDEAARERAHPLERLVYIYQDLAAWHAALSPGQLEANLQRVLVIQSAWNETAVTHQAIKTLQFISAGWKKVVLNKPAPLLEEWTFLQYHLARLLEQEQQLTAAVKAALAGEQAAPQSLAGQLCQGLRERIQAPRFSFSHALLNPLHPAEASAFDSGGARIIMRHRNLKRIFLRAYALPLALNEKLAFGSGFNREENVRTMLAQAKPVLELDRPLTDHGDYQEQSDSLTLALPKIGWYLLVASTQPSFFPEPNTLTHSLYIVSDLALISRIIGPGAEIYCVQAQDGKPVPGAQIAFYEQQLTAGQPDFSLKHQGQTNQQGIYTVLPSSGLGQGSYLVVVQQGENVCMLPGSFSLATTFTTPSHRVFIYTDRSIYRPGEEVHFKILAMQADRQAGNYQVQQQFPLSLEIKDPNQKVLETFSLLTNVWGSASGSWKIPFNRLRGEYRLQYKSNPAEVAWTEGGRFRVEEYQLPKFMLTRLNPAVAMRLNTPAQLQGQAEYYLGGPLKRARVQYQIERRAKYPVWFAWFYPRPLYFLADPVARGTVLTDEQGLFSILFTPWAKDSLKDTKEVNYVFLVKVSITDIGGDTITQSRSYSIGQVSWQAEIELSSGFPVAGEPFALTIKLQDLNGVSQTGEGQLNIYPLLRSESFLAPAASIAEPESLLVMNTQETEMAALARDASIFWRRLKHTSQGQAQVTGLTLPPASYLAEYKIQDPFGQEVIARRFILVAPAGKTEANLPASLTLVAQQPKVSVGQAANFLISAALPATVYFELHQKGKTIFRQLYSHLPAQQIQFPVTEDLRGGFTAELLAVHQYRLYRQYVAVDVPWENKELKLEFVRLRPVLSPGEPETLSLKITGPPGQVPKVEILASMTDQALDYFFPHTYPDLARVWAHHLEPVAALWSNNFQSAQMMDRRNPVYVSEPIVPHFRALGYSPGRAKGRAGKYFAAQLPPAGPIVRGAGQPRPAGKTAETLSPAAEKSPAKGADVPTAALAAMASADQLPETNAGPDFKLRRNFIATAFFQPHLLSDEKGEVSIKFLAPDSVTTWNLIALAQGKLLEAGYVREILHTRRDFMLQPYVPRFLREGDHTKLQAVIHNQTDQVLSGQAFIQLLNEQATDVTEKFFVSDTELFWQADPHSQTSVAFSLTAPLVLGKYQLRIIARSGQQQDGEEHWLPVLPSRNHLMESHFLVLKDQAKQTLELTGLKYADQDPTIQSEALVVTLDGQLVYTLLHAMPYLLSYPYASVEQTLNRFVCLGLLHGTFQRYPTLAQMAQKFSQRPTPLETWDQLDANRKLQLEETPWLVSAQGGEPDQDYLNSLDPHLVQAQTQASLDQLQQAQRPDGSFTWFSGGPADFYMTLYVLAGLTLAEKAGVTVPKTMLTKALTYCALNYEKYLKPSAKPEASMADPYLSIYLNYVLSAFSDPSYKTILNRFNRSAMFKASLKDWQQLSLLGRAMLALTFHRFGDQTMALRIIQSLLDVAKTSETEGTYWAPEPKAWLWYQDNIESHAWILKAMLEIKPEDTHTDGIALWLLRHKQGNQWKSTRATASAIEALVAYLHERQSLEVPEKVRVFIPPQQVMLDWQPGHYQGRQQVILTPDKITPASSLIDLVKTGRGNIFATVTWHYSTQKIPPASQGDVLALERKYYRIKTKGRREWLEPLPEQSGIKLGDEMAVELLVQARLPMEYVYLHDPRAAGFAPEQSYSGYQWKQLSYYQEIRDSGANFFFDRLPAGSFNFQYRLRANQAGTFVVGPAVIQSMYAPEFGAHSAGQLIQIME